jgi:hypothetical protein
VKSRLLLVTLFLGALAIALAGWIVGGGRWLVTAPVRRFRGRDELESRLAS